MSGVIANHTPPPQSPSASVAPSAPLARLLELTADAVQAVRVGRSLTDVLAQSPAATRPAVQALSFHVLRWLGSATELRVLLAPKTPPPKVDALLVTALALLWPAAATGAPLPYAEHTLVDQAVSAARLRVPAAAAFINAVLRRFLRERDPLVAAVGQQPLGAYNHPLWWTERLRRDWPADWQALLASANQRPPMTLRINRRRCSGASYQQRLAAQGRASVLLSEQTLVVTEPCAVQLLPGFADGDFSVQDAAAQCAAPLLLQGLHSPAGDAAREPGTLPRVLDACAAPGGKTAHLLELAELDLLALDSDATRLARVGEGLRRLRLLPAPGAPAVAGATGTLATPAGRPVSRVHMQVGDARQPSTWWDGRPFDAVLLDAPCTASGIVRRHPDVRWLRRADDVAALARVQAQLLAALWPLLAPGGRLLYATCSIFKAEGQQPIDAFLQRQGAAAARLDAASPGHLLSSRDNAGQASGGDSAVLQDGFFYALIHKT